ncbi:hypothetical protein EPIR_3604 [Erwinia piriflorinigrans CFBP 5888]|uniref:Uncharacterized protein n=1 Tax=Erwinia piriflorinigrans CFBP 5888 TaxID=1161919 RepID=V5ZD30_9GAMM|nr:hypothetical protein EPIR_3604 [Erwinia piriflorinigrans CFBP 5888]
MNMELFLCALIEIGNEACSLRSEFNYERKFCHFNLLQ